LGEAQHGGRHRVTRTGLATPEGPEDPFDWFEAEFADTERDCCAFRTLVVPLSDPDGSVNGKLIQVKRSHLSSAAAKILVFDANVLNNWQGMLDRSAAKDLRLAAEHLMSVEAMGAPLPTRPVWYARLLFRNQYARVSPQKLTGLAVFIAGHKRAVLGNEWRSHLAGETGAGLPADRQVCEAAGFVLAAIQYRLQDAADLAWRPVDAVLGSRALSSCFVFLATLGFSLWLMRKVGVYGLAECLESVGVVFAAALGAIHAGRWWRGSKPPEHKPRRAKELQRAVLTTARVANQTAPSADVRRHSRRSTILGLSTGSC
jgi:hypothetical protein